mmetsp:Transcript_11403/g.25023  ORF Transcript_11403/g.25023 Transcript_11403/m.25023 type:complete len:299 (-) Transcript_11403:475-1371(-)
MPTVKATEFERGLLLTSNFPYSPLPVVNLFLKKQKYVPRNKIKNQIISILLLCNIPGILRCGYEEKKWSGNDTPFLHLQIFLRLTPPAKPPASKSPQNSTVEQGLNVLITMETFKSMTLLFPPSSTERSNLLDPDLWTSSFKKQRDNVDCCLAKKKTQLANRGRKPILLDLDYFISFLAKNDTPSRRGLIESAIFWCCLYELCADFFKVTRKMDYTVGGMSIEGQVDNSFTLEIEDIRRGMDMEIEEVIFYIAGWTLSAIEKIHAGGCKRWQMQCYHFAIIHLHPWWRQNDLTFRSGK